MRAVYILCCGNGARLTDIANQLGVSKASACVAMTKLEEKGFVIRDAGRLIVLTPDGQREAKRVDGNFRAIYLFLTKELNVDSETALMDAGALEHVVSEVTVSALRSALHSRCD